MFIAPAGWREKWAYGVRVIHYFKENQIKALCGKPESHDTQTVEYKDLSYCACKRCVQYVAAFDTPKRAKKRY